jgi:hypothetical protein
MLFFIFFVFGLIEFGMHDALTKELVDVDVVDSEHVNELH